jgi:hypothetical protein
VNLSPAELSQLQDLDIIELANKIRKVRTPEGAKKYGVPIGTPITKDMEDALQGKSGGAAPTSTVQSGANNYGSNSGKSATPAAGGPVNAQGKTAGPVKKGQPFKEQQGLIGKHHASDPKPGAETQSAVAEAVQANLTVTDSTISGPLKFSVGQAQYSAPSGSVLVKAKKGSGGGAYVRTPDGAIHAFNQEGEITLPDNLADILSLKFTKNFKSDAKYVKAEFDNDDTESFPELAAGAVLQADGQDMFTKGEDGFWTHKDIDVSLTDEDLAPMFESGELSLKETPVGFNEAGKADFKNMSKDEFRSYLYSKKKGEELYLNGKLITFDGEFWSEEDGEAILDSTLVVLRSKISETPDEQEEESTPATEAALLTTADFKKMSVPEFQEYLNSREEGAELYLGNKRLSFSGSGWFFDNDKRIFTPELIEKRSKLSESLEKSQPSTSVAQTPSANKLAVGDTVSSAEEEKALPEGSVVDLRLGGGKKKTPATKQEDGKWKYNDIVVDTLGFNLASGNVTVKSLPDQQGASASVESLPPESPVAQASLATAVTSVEQLAGYPNGTKLQFQMPNLPEDIYTKGGPDEWYSSMEGLSDTPVKDAAFDSAIKKGYLTELSVAEQDDTLTMADLYEMQDGEGIDVGGDFYVKQGDQWMDADGSFMEQDDFIEDAENGNIEPINSTLAKETLDYGLSNKNAAEEAQKEQAKAAAAQAQKDAQKQQEQAQAEAQKIADQAAAQKAAEKAAEAAQKQKNQEFKAAIDKAKEDKPAVGKIVSTVAELDALPGGSVFTLEAPAGTYDFAKVGNQWVGETGTPYLSFKFEAAVEGGKVSIKSLSDVPQPSAGGNFWVGGKEYTSKDFSDALKALEAYHGQLSYGLTTFAGGSLAFADKQNQEALKSAAQAEFPNLGAKPAVIAYLKKQLEAVSAPGGNFQVGGKVFTTKDFSDALTALESHSGFQISYGLKSAKGNPFLDKENEAGLKALALNEFPDLKPKPAVVAYLKKQLGIQTADAPEEASAEQTGTSIYFGSRTPKKGVQGLNGGSFDQADVESAISILQNYKGKLYKNELNKQGNALGVLDPVTIVGFFKDKEEGKQAYIKLLQAKLDKSKSSAAPSNEPEQAPSAPVKATSADVNKLSIGSKVTVFAPEGSLLEGSAEYTKKSMFSWSTDNEDWPADMSDLNMSYSAKQNNVEILSAVEMPEEEAYDPNMLVDAVWTKPSKAKKNAKQAVTSSTTEVEKTPMQPGDFSKALPGAKVSMQFDAATGLDPQLFEKVSSSEWKNTTLGQAGSFHDDAKMDQFLQDSGLPAKFYLDEDGQEPPVEEPSSFMSYEDIKAQSVGAKIQYTSNSGKEAIFTKVNDFDWDSSDQDVLPDLDNASLEPLAKKNKITFISAGEEKEASAPTTPPKAPRMSEDLWKATKLDALPVGQKIQAKVGAKLVYVKKDDGNWHPEGGGSGALTSFQVASIWEPVQFEILNEEESDAGDIAYWNQSLEVAEDWMELEGTLEEMNVGAIITDSTGVSLQKKTEFEWAIENQPDGSFETNFDSTIIAQNWDNNPWTMVKEGTGTYIEPVKMPSDVKDFFTKLHAPLNKKTEGNVKPGDALSLKDFQDLNTGSVFKIGTNESITFKKNDYGNWIGQQDSHLLNEAEIQSIVDTNNGIFVSGEYAGGVEVAQAPTKIGEALTSADLFDQSVGTIFQDAENKQVFYEKTINGTWEDTESGSVLTSAAGDAFVEKKTAILYTKGIPDVPDYAQAPAAVQNKQTGNPATDISINESSLTPGKYSTENGKAYMVVSADGSGVYVTSSGEVTAINAPKVIANHKAGMTKYQGVVENPPVPTEESSAAAKKKTVLPNQVIPSGTYYSGPSNNPASTVYIVSGDDVKIYKQGAEPKVGKQSSIQSVFKKGQLLDAAGNSVFPKGYTGTVYLFGHETTIPALVQAKKALDGVEPIYEGANIQGPEEIKLKQAGVYFQFTSSPNLASHQAAIDSMLSDVDMEEPESGAANLFDWDGLGNVIYPKSLVGMSSTYAYKIAEKNAFIKAASEAIGGGKIIGLHTNGMSKYQKSNWITAFQAGDFAEMYKIEVDAAASKGLAHAAGYLHPGYENSPTTNKITWGASVAGEVPAGSPVAVKLDAAYENDWHKAPIELVDNYLIAAQMQNPTYLNLKERRLWVMQHELASKFSGVSKHSYVTGVNQLSLTAQSRSNSGEEPYTKEPQWTDPETIKPPKVYAQLFEAGQFPISGWTATAAQQWYQDNTAEFEAWATAMGEDALPHSLFQMKANVYAMRDGVQAYFTDKKAQYDAEQLIPVYTKNEIQTVKGSTNPVHQYTDQHGNKYFFKPRADSKLDKYRSEVEHMGNMLSRALGFNASKSSLETLNGQYGQLQTDAGGVGDLMNADYGKQSLVTLKDVAAEHLLDWFLDNDDTKGDNVRVMENGHVVGIDKGRAFKSYGAWKGLSGDSSMNSNANTVYSQMYAAIRSGKISKQDADEIFKATRARALKMQKFSDAKIDAFLDEGMKNRTSYDVPYKLSDGTYAPDSLDGLKMAVKDRRDRLAQDFEAMWSKIYAQAGYGELPEIPDSPLGDIISGLDHEKLHTEVFEAATHGKSTIINNASVVGGTVHLWTEKNKKSDKLFVKGEMYVGDKKQRELLSFFTKHAGGVTESKMQTGFNSDVFGEKIVKAAKTVNLHALDQKYNVETIAAFQKAKDDIDKDLDAWTPDLKANDTFAGEPAFAFPSGTTVPLIHVDQYKLMLSYYKPKADLVANAYAAEGKVENIANYEPLQLAVSDKEEKYVSTQGSTLTKLNGGDFLFKNASTGAVSTISASDAEFYYSDSSWSKLNEPEAVTTNLPYSIQLNVGTHEKTAVYDDKNNLKIELESAVGTKGARGSEYQVTLDTGEKIFWRNAAQTGTARGQHGKLTFFLPDASDSQGSQASMARVQAVLADLGLGNGAADDTTARNIYWREMYGVMMNRKHKPGSKHQKTQDALKKKISEIGSTEGSFIEDFSNKVSPEEENNFWMDLYSAEWPTEVSTLIDNEGYLPKFDHLNIQNVELESGKPYWDRFDVPDEHLADIGLFHESSTEINTILESGALFSGEERIRQLGFLATPQALYGKESPLRDQSNGSSHQIYTRIRKLSGGVPDAVRYVVDPRALRRTRTYGLSGDKYGSLAARKSDSPSDAQETLERFQGMTHEIMSPNVTSLLDSMLVVLYDKAEERNAMIQRLKELGVTEIRGIPVEDRLVMRQDAKAAMKKIKDTMWKK